MTDLGVTQSTEDGEAATPAVAPPPAENRLRADQLFLAARLIRQRIRLALIQSRLTPF